MFSLRRGVITAVCILTLFYLFRSSPKVPSPHDPAERPGKVPIADAGAGLESSEQAPIFGSADGASRKRKGDTGKAEQEALGYPPNKALLDRLEHHFPYDIEQKFPAYIWQTWKYTPASEDFGEVFRPAEASWSELHPTFTHEIISDNVASHLIRYLYLSFPEVVEAYDSLPLPILKADFFRYLILLARGGIYSDIDTYAIKPATDWISDLVPRSSFGLVIGIEADPDRADWHQWYSRRIQFCQWTIQAKPGHPVLREIVASITQETLRRKENRTLKSKDAVKGIVEYTGPAIWTDVVFRYFNDPRYFNMDKSTKNITWEQFTGITEAKQVGDVIVLPITGFSPGIGHSGSEGVDHPMACVKHEFEGTWKPEIERHIGESEEDRDERLQREREEKDRKHRKAHKEEEPTKRSRKRSRQAK